jgi:hypothetical protein
VRATAADVGRINAKAHVGMCKLVSYWFYTGGMVFHADDAHLILLILQSA